MHKKTRISMANMVPKKENDDDFEYFSEEGFRRLKAELEHLRTVKRKEVAKRLEYAKSLGDLSENSEYTEAKTMQENNESRIVELEDMLSRSVLIKKTSTMTVSMGSTVKVQRKGGDEEQYTVVGSEEADPTSRKISNESPLGRAFLGCKKGESVTVTTPRGSMDYMIVEIV